MSEPLLTATDIHKSYRMGRGLLQVLRGCRLDVQPGEFVAIMGKSGSGKSTLLQILGALDIPDRGELHIAGRPTFAPQAALERVLAPLDAVLRVLQRLMVMVVAVLLVVILIGAPLGLLGFPLLVGRVPGALQAALYGLAGAVALLLGFMLLLLLTLLVRLLLVHIGERRRVELRRRSFGFVFQFYHLLPELSALENVVIARQTGSSILGWLAARGPARRDARAILERVGLGERLRHRPHELSGGERQRVAIARALVHRPRILFADEPTGNLDAQAGADLMSLLKSLHREGQTIVMVTHDAAVAAQADRILELDEGRLRPLRDG